METQEFPKDNNQLIVEAAKLLEETFPHSYKGRGIESFNKLLGDDRIAIAALDNGRLVGFVGAIPQYGVTGWELHPLMVKKEEQRRGVGTLLVRKLETVVASRGGVTIYLGTDDEFDQTSLGNVDLYQDTYAKIENIINHDSHPYEFYVKMGYKIVGVIPDANGLGKPDIWMAKRVKQKGR